MIAMAARRASCWWSAVVERSTRAAVGRQLGRALVVVSMVARGCWNAAIAEEAATCPPPLPVAPTAQQAQEGIARAQDRGFLWRLTKDDHSSYLYGTIHMARREWIFPGPKVLQALREVDTVALEVNPLDPRIRQALGSGSATQPSAVELPESLKARIERRLAFECVAPETVAKLAPAAQVLALTLLAGRRNGLEPGYAIDAMLAGFGHAAHKNLVSLETTEVQLGARRALTGEASVAALEKTLDELESGRAAAVLDRLANLWATADMAELKRYEHSLSESSSETERALLKEVIDSRNVGLAKGIDALHSKGGKVFAGVGFMHMIGPASLPTLLAGRGFEVQAIKFGP
jgi:uncharacterized protein